MFFGGSKSGLSFYHPPMTGPGALSKGLQQALLIEREEELVIAGQRAFQQGHLGIVKLA
jgi:hypothetical protein